MNNTNNELSHAVNLLKKTLKNEKYMKKLKIQNLK